jgi:BASS family bile acid:Na+ symporter
MTWPHRLALLASAILLVLSAAGMLPWGIAVIVTSVVIVTLVRRYPLWQGAAYGISVGAFAVAGFFDPAWFTSWDLPGWTGRDSFELKFLIVPLLQIIMFAMGTTLSVQDFQRVAVRPWGVGLGLALQFSIMPLVGWLLARAFQLDPMLAAGVVLVGCSPGGVASNVIVFLARGNVALSVTMTAVSSLAAPIATPLLMQLIVGGEASIDAWKLAQDIAWLTVIPVLGGLVVHHLFARQLTWLADVLPILSIVAIGLIVGIVTAAERDDLWAAGVAVAVVVVLHNGLGFVLGYTLARLCRLSVTDARTVSVEVGLQNSGLAASLAATSLQSVASALPAALFSVWQNLAGSLLAGWWRQGETFETAK